VVSEEEVEEDSEVEIVVVPEEDLAAVIVAGEEGSAVVAVAVSTAQIHVCNAVKH
jgi:hypothetical protein